MGIWWEGVPEAGSRAAEGSRSHGCQAEITSQSLIMTMDFGLWRHLIMEAADRGLNSTRHLTQYTYTRHLLHFGPDWERDPSHVALPEVSTFSAVNS